jgi:hypothetical protein
VRQFASLCSLALERRIQARLSEADVRALVRIVEAISAETGIDLPPNHLLGETPLFDDVDFEVYGAGSTATGALAQDELTRRFDALRPSLDVALKRTSAQVEKAPTLRTGGYVIDFWGAGFEVASRIGLLPDLTRTGYQVREVRVVDCNGRKVSGFPADAFARGVPVNDAVATHIDEHRGIGRGALSPGEPIGWA